MGFLTEAKLNQSLDLPIAVPATNLRQGDWLVVASVKVVSPMRLSYQHVNLAILEATADLTKATASNRIYGNLGFAYLALRRDYTGQSPGAAGALDVFAITAVGQYARPGAAIEFTTPGTYSWILANNFQASNNSGIAPSTSIDLRVAVTGLARLSL